MAATAVSSAPVTAMDTSDEAKNELQVNAYRIAVVTDRLTLQLSNTSKFNPDEFPDLCLSLARGIDFSVANQDIPARAQDLPLLLKQVCRSRNDTLLAGIMVLMISVKSACQSGWFSERDSEELCSLANQISMRFCSSMDFNTEPTSSHTAISTIMTRFYPRLKMGHVFMFLEVKPGFGAYMRDFQISKKMKYSPEEKIRLLIAQTDNIETSSCLISPQDVNFLLNGKAVDRRTNTFMDAGPQMPTIVRHMLKYGSNLLQAVGQFNGNYVITLALMAEFPTMERPVIQDYVQPAASVVDPDSEIIEGPSRISLNCPISFKRIKTPVKGHSCKHLQCFDFDNYMDINSKRPSWRCPHCNHHVCFTDIRIDQNMVKVLKDVGENVNDVIISSDGSWKAIMESEDHSEKQFEKFSVMEEDGPEEPGSPMISNNPRSILDLTQADDVVTAEAEEQKVFPSNSQAQSIPENVMHPRSTTNEMNQSTSSRNEDSFWTGLYLSTFGSNSPLSDALSGGIPESSPNDALVSPVFTDGNSPVFTDGNSPAPDCEAGALQGNALVAISGPQSEIASQTALQLQPFHFGNSSNSSEYGRQSTARYVSRTAGAVQALPAQAPTTVPQRSRSSPSHLINSGPLAASQPSAAPFSRNMERQQQSSRSHDSFLVSQAASSPKQQHSHPLNHQFISALAQQVPGLQVSNNLRDPNPSPLPGQFQNLSAQQMMNLRLPYTRNPSPGIVSPHTSGLRMPNAGSQSAGLFPASAQSPPTTLQSQGHQGGAQGLGSQAARGVNGQHAEMVAQQTAQSTRASRMASLAVGDQRSTGSMTQSTMRSDTCGNSPADQDWRPSGRMRGSLSRQDINALSQYIIQPTQQAQATRTHASSQLQILMANRAALQAVGTGSYSMSGSSGVLSPRSSEMK